MRFRSLKKPLLITLGSISLILAVIGIFLPLLPTTPFLIVSAWCFKNGSDKLHQWLMRQPKLGPAIREWENERVIRPRAKFLACLLITLSIGYVIAFKPLELWLKAVLGVFALSIMGFIVTRRSTPQ